MCLNSMGKFLSILLFFINVTQVFASDDDIIFRNAEIINEYTSRLPFKLIDHLIVVEAELYGKIGNFIIDTGSEALILNKIHFASKYPHHKKYKQSSGVNGTIENTQIRLLHEFRLHNFNIKNIKSDVIDLSHIERSKKMNLLGIIGFEILKKYEVFIDLHLNQITLSKVDKYGNRFDKNTYLEKITDSINFNLVNHTIVINAFVKDQKVRFCLDSGAEYNQINSQINKKILKSFFPKKRLYLIGISDKKIEVLLGKLYRVKLNKTIYFRPMYTVLTNLNKMNEAYGTKLDGVLGYEFFMQKRTIINYQKEKLFFIDYPKKYK